MSLSFLFIVAKVTKYSYNSKYFLNYFMFFRKKRQLCQGTVLEVNPLAYYVERPPLSCELRNFIVIQLTPLR